VVLLFYSNIAFRSHTLRTLQLDIYQLLHQEAEFVSVRASLVSDAKLRRYQRKEWDSWNFRSVLFSLVEAKVP